VAPSVLAQNAERDHRGRNSAAPYRLYFWILACAWTAAVGGSLAWNLAQNAEETENLTKEAARALLEKDLMYREASLMNGGMYVMDPGAETPSRAQVDEERVVVTPSGKKLTLLNPALVSRRLFEQGSPTNGIRGRLTSLHPIRVANRPDAWEREALTALTAGQSEASTVERRPDGDYFRMMRPLYTTGSCFRCHEESGQVPGALRGGISVMVPMKRFVTKGERGQLTTAHVGFWVVGIIWLAVGARHLRKHVEARQHAEGERERLISELQQALATVKTLDGLIPICASCKKIRDDHGYWTRLETYLEQHSQAEFSHSLCLDCLHKLYPEIAEEVQSRLSRPVSPPAKAPLPVAANLPKH